MDTASAFPGITVASIHFADLRDSSCFHANARADAVAIGLRSNELQLNPVAGLFRYVVKQEQRLIGIGLNHIQPAIIVKIPYRYAPAVQIVVHARLSGDFLEGAIA